MLVAMVAAAVVVYALVVRRLATTWVSGAMVFTVLGVLASDRVLGVVEADHAEAGLELLLELTLVAVLFGDAFSVRRWDPRRDRTPLRLLVVGMPLTIVAGWGAAAMLFGSLGIWEAASLATILAPTDAALGVAVVSDRRLPRRIRHALNVESGLNEGFALPFLTVFLLLAAAAAGDGDGSDVAAVERFVRALLLSGGIGGAGAWAAAKGLRSCAARGWTTTAWVRIGLLTTGLGVYALATALEGSGFIAAWVAGFVAGRTIGDTIDDPTAFVEDVGAALSLAAFFSFGALFLVPVLTHVTWPVLAYAALSLTVVRMIPVAASLLGTKLRAPSVWFLGWFGPRGLASLVFVLAALDLPGRDTILAAVAATVAASVLLHGLTSVPAVARYAGWFERERDEGRATAEAAATGEPPTRGRFRHAD